MIRFNILSPENLKIFYEKNKIIVNIVYSFLGIYILIYLVFWGYEFYKQMKRKRYNILV